MNHDRQATTAHAPLRSTRERLLHASVFESIALVVCAPVLAWWMDKPLAHMGVLTAAISLIAMGWNMLFNNAFDRLRQRWQVRLSMVLRAVHAVLFELGLIVIIVPLAAWWLDVSLWQALLMDIGVLLFFLPYTFVFNWVWDAVRPADKQRSGSAAVAAAASTTATTTATTCDARS